jgi:uncharacterized membrane protein YdjX (TVP38/TMEM64 family)
VFRRAGTKFPLLVLRGMKHKWTQREFKAFKEWEKRFDRPIWWMLAVTVCLPILGILLTAMTNSGIR